MKILDYFILDLFLLIFIGNSNAQSIAIGQWRDHLPYEKCISVTEAGDKIYCATPYDIFYYDKSDNSVNRISKITGLSDIGISSINYNTKYKTLVVAYTDANIDLIKDNTIINISDIKRKQILGNKTINKILFVDKYAYLSCGFGIVVLDIDKEEIHDTYYIGPEGSHINVLDLTFDDDDSLFFAATEKGIYKASYNNPNLAYFASWTKDTIIPHPDLKYNIIEYFNKKVYVNNSNSAFGSDTVFAYDGNNWYQPFDTSYVSTRRNILSLYDKLVIVNYSNVDVFDKDLNKIMRVWTYNPGSVVPQDAIIDEDNSIWIADCFSGLVKSWNKGWNSEQIKPNGPCSNKVFSMAVADNDLWVTPGGKNSSWGNLWNYGGLYSFIDNNWNSYNHRQYEFMDTIRDVLCAAVDPYNIKRVYVGSWGYGLYEFVNGKLNNIYTDANSSLQQNVEAARINIGGLCFDNNDNLWIANSSASSILSVKESNGDWKAFNLGSFASGIEAGQIAIDSCNQKWILTREHNIFVFNDNNTISNTSDDQVKKLSGDVGNGNLPGNYIHSIAVDLDGQVWIGTDQGVAVFYSPENIFTNDNFDAEQILVEYGGHYRPLLESEDVTAIAVNGANQKWFGTERAGVFLMSDDGTKEIHHFTEENSPLFSNSITSIVINKDGEVFFGTSKGIISYKDEAVPPNQQNENVYAYPNPVREGYNGTIAIKGLVGNADVKITDISGTLIYATKAQGGQAIWDGKNFNGRKAHTGVYLVFVSNDDGSKTLVTKILFMN